MKDIMQKLAELEATAPKATKKKMLNEDSTTPPMNVSDKPASLKDIFETMAMQKPIPVVGKEGDTAQTGAGFLNVTDNSPAAQALSNALGDLAQQKKVQIVVPTQSGQSAQAGATGQPQQGQMQMQEKDEGKPGKNFAKIAKSAGKRYGSKEAGERVAGAVRAKLAKQGKLEEESMEESGLQAYLGNKKYGKEGMDALRKAGREGASKEKMANIRAKYDKMDEAQLDEISPELASRTLGARQERISRGVAPGGPKDFAANLKSNSRLMTRAGLIDNPRHRGPNDSYPNFKSDTMRNPADTPRPAPVKEGAKVDRMVKHIEKSERKLGKSKDEAENIAWATANKRGMLDNKNKKKVKEGDIPSTHGQDTMGAGLGAGRSRTTLEGKKPDFLDLDKDGNKKESMKKAAADKKKQKVKESMNHRISAARLEGKSHGLRGHAHSGKRYEDLEEMKAYHEGYKDGMDELHGMGMYETAPAATVPGMASQAMPTMEDGMAASGTAWKDDGRIGWINTTFANREGRYTFPSTVSMTSDADALKYIKSGQLTPDLEVLVVYPDNRKVKYKASEVPELSRLFKSEPSTGMEEGNAFTAALAKTPKGGKFTVGGKTFTDRSDYSAKVDEYAFESLDKQLNALLTESEEVTEGLSVSVSKGQQNSPDSVTITAQDAEAEQLLQLVKHAGLGLFGDDHDHAPSSAMSIQPTHGAPDEVGAGGVDVEVVDGNDGIMGLMQKLSGIQSAGADDYADEEGEEQLHGNHSEVGKKDCGCEDDCECEEKTDEAMCNECGTYEGMHESGCSMNKKKVDEVETEDQMEFEVSEDNAPDSGAAETTADENAEAEEDKALALKSVNESFFDILARLEKLAEGSGDEPKHPKHDEKDEKDFDDAEKEEDVKESEELNEWANNAGKKGTDASFEADIDFMTKVIAGGLNKPKSTGQTTVPVIAGQESRMHDHQGTVSDSIDDWTKLAGIK